MQIHIEETSSQLNTFISPENMLKGLIKSLDFPCNCGQTD